MTKYNQREILLEKYRDIPETDFHSMIVFFENYESWLKLHCQDIFPLIFREYLDALDKAGHYSKYCDRIDEEIQNQLTESAFDKDHYAQLIYSKAYATHFLMQWEECEKILSEYVKMCPEAKQGKQLCIMNVRRRLKSTNRWLYGLVIALLLGMCAILITEIFVFDTFLDSFKQKVFVFRNSLFLVAVTLLLGFELWSSYRGYRRHQEIKAVLNPHKGLEDYTS